MKTNTRNITAYVNKQLERTGSDNVAIYLPGLDGRVFNALCVKFKEVKRKPFGYIYFRK